MAITQLRMISQNERQLRLSVDRKSNCLPFSSMIRVLRVCRHGQKNATDVLHGFAEEVLWLSLSSALRNICSSPNVFFTDNTVTHSRVTRLAERENIP